MKTMRHPHADHLDRLYAIMLKCSGRSGDILLSEIVRVCAHHGLFCTYLFDPIHLVQLDSMTEDELEVLQAALNDGSQFTESVDVSADICRDLDDVIEQDQGFETLGKLMSLGLDDTVGRHVHDELLLLSSDSRTLILQLGELSIFELVVQTLPSKHMLDLWICMQFACKYSPLIGIWKLNLDSAILLAPKEDRDSEPMDADDSAPSSAQIISSISRETSSEGQMSAVDENSAGEDEQDSDIDRSYPPFEQETTCVAELQYVGDRLWNARPPNMSSLLQLALRYMARDGAVLSEPQLDSLMEPSMIGEIIKLMDDSERQKVTRILLDSASRHPGLMAFWDGFCTAEKNYVK